MKKLKLTSGIKGYKAFEDMRSGLKAIIENLNEAVNKLSSASEELSASIVITHFENPAKVHAIPERLNLTKPLKLMLDVIADATKIKKKNLNNIFPSKSFVEEAPEL